MVGLVAERGGELQAVSPFRWDAFFGGCPGRWLSPLR